jgi:hypothetical protein
VDDEQGGGGHSERGAADATGFLLYVKLHNREKLLVLVLRERNLSRGQKPVPGLSTRHSLSQKNSFSILRESGASVPKLRLLDQGGWRELRHPATGRSFTNV